MTSGECVRIELSLQVYDLSAVQRAAHRFSATHFVEISANGASVTVDLTTRGDLRFLELEAEFKNALLDEQLRTQINHEVRPIREALIKAALDGASPRRKP